MTRVQVRLLKALKAKGWGALPWSDEDAEQWTLCVYIASHVLVAQIDSDGLGVMLAGPDGGVGLVLSPAHALNEIERQHRDYAEWSSDASVAAAGLRAMLGGECSGLPEVAR